MRNSSPILYDSDTTATDVDHPLPIHNHPDSPPTSLNAPISPPQSKRRKLSQELYTQNHVSESDLDNSPNLAAIEAGEASICDHLDYFSKHLSRCIRNSGVAGEKTGSGGMKLLAVEKWKDLYRRNEHERGRHFVVHQHDHPVAGMCSNNSPYLQSLRYVKVKYIADWMFDHVCVRMSWRNFSRTSKSIVLLHRGEIDGEFKSSPSRVGVHYDLRLQISESSSISFAIMYGLPGNPNSRRLNRNATETRVHNLWVSISTALSIT